MPKFLDFTISSITQVWFAVSAPLHKSPVKLAAIHFSIAASPPFLTSSQGLADTDLPFAQYSYSLYTTFLAAQLWRCGTRSTKFGYLLDHNWISLDFNW